MLIAALEKLFQSIEYAHYPIKDEMNRKQNLKEADSLGFIDQIASRIKELREQYITVTFHED